MLKLGRLFFLSLILMGFSYSATAGQNRLSVFVSILPQKYIVQQIGKDLVDVHVMVQPGADPHTYEPKPKQMRALSQARLYFAIGVPFEKSWLGRIGAANPQMRMIHTDQGIAKRPMTHHSHDKEEGDHKADSDHEDDDGGLDPHIWLSPVLVKSQARIILTALQEAGPARAAAFKANYDLFLGQVDELDARLRQTFSGKAGLAFMVFHPSWGYFAADYGLRQIPIEIEGKNPKPAQVQALIQQAREKGINVIFVQPQFSAKSAGLIARAIHGQVVSVDPLARDWMANLQKVADAFSAALR